MFDFAWTEIALIGVVALVAIGPKDMPGAIKAVADLVKKARRMAGEFQTHVDEMVREANLDEVRTQISQIRNLDIKGTIERAVDGDGSIRKTFTEDPLKPSYTPPSPTTTAGTTMDAVGEPVGDPIAAHLGSAAPDAVPSDAPAPPPSVPAGDAAVLGSRNLDRPSWLDSAGAGAGAHSVASARAAPAFIPPAIAAPPVPPAFIPPGTPLGARPGGYRPSA
jgi:sec-independent protein translocase protein TatB